MILRRLAWLGFALFPVSCTHAPTPERWPTGGWPVSTPEAQGMNGSILEAIHREFEEGRHGCVDGMLVVRHGHVVFERNYRRDYDRLFKGKGVPGPYNYYDPDWHPYFKRTDLHTLQSISKSVTSALIGIAIGRGELPGVDAPVMPYLAGFKFPERDARRERLTLRHLLTMTAGIRWDETSATYTSSANSCALMEGTDDWIQFVLNQPMAEEPGRAFVYSSGVTQLLSFILRKATGKEADDYAAEHLFAPLGIKRYFWKRTPKGLADTEGGLYMTPRDLAKIGYLYLKNGLWEGRRVLPEGWVAASTTASVDPRLPKAPGRRYGYQWWLLSPEGGAESPAWAALGYGGQRLIVVPELDLVAVVTGWNVQETPALDPEFALDRVLGAVQRE